MTATLAPEEAKEIIEVVKNVLCAVHGSTRLCDFNLQEMRKDQDKTAVHGWFKIRSRLPKTRPVAFIMELDSAHHLISYACEP